MGGQLFLESLNRLGKIHSKACTAVQQPFRLRGIGNQWRNTGSPAEYGYAARRFCAFCFIAEIIPVYVLFHVKQRGAFYTNYTKNGQIYIELYTRVMYNKDSSGKGRRNGVFENPESVDIKQFLSLLYKYIGR